MTEEPTTPDLEERSRQGFAAVIRRDFDAVECFYAPDAVLRGAEVGTFEGRAAIRGLFEDMTSPYEEFHGEIEEVIDLGNGVIFAAITASGRPVGSSAEVRLNYATVLMWAEGTIEQQTNYVDIEEARAAAERLAQERPDG
jgi:ketosteroid isomerase-like protein